MGGTGGLLIVQRLIRTRTQNNIEEVDVVLE